MDEAALLDSPVGKLRVTAPPGYDLTGADWSGDGVLARVTPRDHVGHCVMCGADVRRYGRSDVRIRDAPSGGVRARMLVRRQRVQCERCDRLSRVHLPNVLEGHRYTERCAAWMASQLGLRSNVAIGSVLGLDEASVRIFAAKARVAGRWRGAPTMPVSNCSSCLRIVHGPLDVMNIHHSWPGTDRPGLIALCAACHADAGARWIVQV